MCAGRLCISCCCEWNRSSASSALNKHVDRKCTSRFVSFACLFLK
ncbi:hypothetical protein JYU34_004386 [Plutella xylostella]|uniref:Uncharacterized protein n=1 Tax=Plutella xylostella TaxID=51655 RepID=A0ABQ7QXU3_PLUXY|nr:hypothetical protein JYU34_004386 [Plutella xylostella]